MDTLIAWRHHIEEASAYEAQEMVSGALEFLDTEHASQAVALGWDEVDLFGIFNGDFAYAHRRLDALGLIPSLYLKSSHVCRIVAIEPTRAVLQTAGGATQHLGRHPPAAEIAIPFWEHPALRKRRS